MNLDPHLTLFTNINSKWVRDPNVKCKTIRLLENNIGENLDDFGYDDLKKKTKKHHQRQPKKEKNDKLDLITIKIFSMTDSIRRIKREAKDWERMTAKDISDKGQLSKIYKEHVKLSNKKTNSRNVK